MRVSLMTEAELPIVANFLAQLNNKQENHIGYCGTEATEIVSSIEDIPYKESFITAYNNDKLVGVVGFEPDFGNKVAEIWGPFVLHDYREFTDYIWGKLIEILPTELDILNLFPNMKNQFVREFASQHDFIAGGNDVILEVQKTDSDRLQNVSLKEITPVHYKDVISLHDRTFPGTYYSGEEIIERVSENNKVFIITDGEELAGYIYVEAEPEFGEASIEFFGVLESKRGQGIGMNLLTGALKWLFSFESITSINLCVDATNENAIKLYEKVGFQVKHEMCFYKKYIVENR